MKNKFCLILFLVGSLVSINAQSLVSEGNRWITGLFYSDIQAWPQPILHELVNETLYEIPLSNADSMYSNLTYLKLFADDEYIGLLRESSDSVIYFLPKDSVQDYVLYDFSVKTGDTVYNVYTRGGIIPKLYVIAAFPLTIVVSNSGSALEYWYYGIGGSQGLMETTAVLESTFFHKMDCMSDLNQRWYPSQSTTIGPCEKTLVGLSSREKVDGDLRIYPNPVNDYFEIETEGLSKFTVRILDALGAVVFQEHYQGGETIIANPRIANLSKGIYLVIVSGENVKSRTTRFIKN